MEGVISHSGVQWELDAERALGKISELIPHFFRSIAIKKIHQVADEIAVREKSKVTLKILQEVASRYTPTRFKAKYSTVFADIEESQTEDNGSEELTFGMEWEAEAREMMSLVPSEFRQQAVSGTEDFARRNRYTRITREAVEGYRKELGF
jgi:hypothetical protein